MPNSTVHKQTAVTAAASVASILYIATTKKFNIWNFLVAVFVGCGAGYGTSMMPDRLEPAIHPNHRKWYHSWKFCLNLTMISGLLWYFFNRKIFMRILIVGCLVGYISHVFLDSQTPRGVPWS